jgi:hypothetical protein
MSKVFIYREDWCEDRETYGTSIVTVTNELKEELALIADEVEEWEIGPEGSYKVSEYLAEVKMGKGIKWVKQQ